MWFNGAQTDHLKKFGKFRDFFSSLILFYTQFYPFLFCYFFVVNPFRKQLFSSK